MFHCHFLFCHGDGPAVYQDVACDLWYNHAVPSDFPFSGKGVYSTVGWGHQSWPLCQFYHLAYPGENWNLQIHSQSLYLPHFCGVSFSSIYHHCTLATGDMNVSTRIALQYTQSNICTERNVCSQHSPFWVCVEQWNYPPFSSRR